MARKTKRKVTKKVLKEIEKKIQKKTGKKIKITKRTNSEIEVVLPDGRKTKIEFFDVAGGLTPRQIEFKISKFLSDLYSAKDLTPLENQAWSYLDSDGRVVEEKKSKSMDVSRKAKHTYELNMRGLFEYVRRGRDRADLVGFDTAYHLTPSEVKKRTKMLEEVLTKEYGLSKKDAKEIIDRAVKRAKKGIEGLAEPNTPYAYTIALDLELRKKGFSNKEIARINDVFDEIGVLVISKRAQKKVNLEKL